MPLAVVELKNVTVVAAKDGWSFEPRTFKTHAELIQNPLVYAKIGSRVERINERLSNYERVKKMVLLDHEMTLEGGQLTPSLKVKRRVVNQMYAAQIESMYQEPKA